MIDPVIQSLARYEREMVREFKAEQEIARISVQCTREMRQQTLAKTLREAIAEINEAIEAGDPGLQQELVNGLKEHDYSQIGLAVSAMLNMYFAKFADQMAEKEVL